jgi:tRNA pseudouridine synthase 9
MSHILRATKYYEECIKSGKITVNGKRVTCDYLIKDSDKLEHLTHRHEPPVLGEDIVVAHEDDSYVVISKPCSIPVHESKFVTRVWMFLYLMDTTP